ncbi:ATP-binding cassette, putative [Eimeria maxima]|uniref:ATP-binding cassette, putative n=1 Tax=Eimeria maxima TaxID=5804 RepID=U6MD25_EIMMA|nr:ATP-binding cassette, putative [Eimeria maxima]CDJ60369.1 ATP-binding cassette, putative [Eimeria maxima]
MNKSPLRESVQRLRRRNAGDGSPRVHGTPQGGPECPTGRGPRVAFLELLRLLKEDKLRVTGVILALLLSSGTQLLLPLAVGKLVDAAAQSPLEQQQHQSAQQAQLGRGDWLRGQEGPTSSSCCSAEAENVMPAVKGAARPEATTIPGPERAAAISTEAAGEHSIWGRLVGAIEERVQTPGARLDRAGGLPPTGEFVQAAALPDVTQLSAAAAGGPDEALISRRSDGEQSTGRYLLWSPLPPYVCRRWLGPPIPLFGSSVTLFLCLVHHAPSHAVSPHGVVCLLLIPAICRFASFACPIMISSLFRLLRVAPLPARHVARLQQQHSKALQGALQRATGALSSRGQLRSLNGEALEAKAFGDALEDVLAAAQRTSVAVGCRHAFVFAAGSGLLIHLVNAAASLVAQGVLTGGQVMSLALYSAFVGSSIQGCATAWSDAYRAAAAADDMLRQLLRPLPPLLASPLDYPSELRRFQAALRQQHQLAKQEQDQEVASTLTAATDHRCPAVEFRDVWFSYPLREGQWALRGLSFKVPPGAVVAVTGPSGSGKSSLGALLLRLFEPQRGGIFFEGLPIHAYDERFIRALVIPVLQDSLLLSGMTLEDQIRYGYMAQQEALGTTPDVHSPVSASCDAACVSKFAATLPEGLQTRLCGSGAVLSGGQKQRVCLAMAFCRLEHSQRDRQKTKLPTVLFMDEATSSLDADTESQVLKNLKRVCSLSSAVSGPSAFAPS